VIPKGRRTFCSGAKTKHGRRIVRVDGEVYGRSERVVLTPGHGCVHEWCIRSNPGYARECVRDRDHGICAICGEYDVSWQADHIVPVCEGGGECGLDGLRTLCRKCHNRETAALAARRAAKRRTEVQDGVETVEPRAAARVEHPASAPEPDRAAGPSRATGAG